MAKGIKPRVFTWLARNRQSRVLAGAANLCHLYLRAHGNASFAMRTNGELWALESLPKGAVHTAIDVGSHTGEWTTNLLTVQPGAEVHCFEADPTLAASLTSSFANRSSVRVNAVALSDRRGTAAFHRYPDRTQSSLESAPGIEIDTIEVEVRTGDDYLEESGIGSVDILKIDTEGHDLAVLRGFTDSLRDHRIRAVQFEYTRWNIWSRSLLIDFYELLEPLGYRVGKLRPTGVEFSSFRVEDEDFLGPNCIAVVADDSQLIDALRGNYPA